MEDAGQENCYVGNSCGKSYDDVKLMTPEDLLRQTSSHKSDSGKKINSNKLFHNMKRLS